MRAHQDRIYNLAYRLTGNHEDANDAAREAFVRAFQALPRFRQDAAFSTWLYRIATNAALDLVRRRPAVPPVELTVDAAVRYDVRFYSGIVCRFRHPGVTRSETTRALGILTHGRAVLNVNARSRVAELLVPGRVQVGRCRTWRGYGW